MVKAVCLPQLICYSYLVGVSCVFTASEMGFACYALERQPTMVQRAGGEARGLGSQHIFVIGLAAAADLASRFPAASQPPLPCGMP